MKTPKGPSHLLLQLIYIILFPVFAAQKAKVSPKMTGYLGKDVTLPCQLIQGATHTSITQVQWAFQEREGTETKKSTIIVFHHIYGVNISDSPLKERVKFHEYSLIIKNVEMRDNGSYTCSISTFPSGTFEGTTKLDVHEKQLTAEMVPAIAIAVVLLLAIVVAVAFLIYIRRRHSSARHRVVIDTTGLERDEAGQSVVRDEDVVYSDVKLKPFRDVTPLFSNKHRDAAHADDVTYSEVVVSNWQPKSDMEYAYV